MDQTTGATGPGECTADQLAVSLGTRQAAGGHSVTPVIFTDTSAQRCFLRAYPGVAAIGDSGVRLAHADRTSQGMLRGLPDGAPVPTITLDPGQVASAGVEGTDNSTDGSECPQPAGLLVTPPDSRTSVPVRGEVPPPCDGLAVHPVVAGDAGGEL